MLIYNILLYTSCSLSIIGDIFMAITIISFKDLRTFNFRMIMYLTLTDLLASIAYLLTPLSKNNHSLCMLQAYLMNFSSLSSLLWTSCIMVALYRLIILEKINEKHIELIFCVISWVVPLVASAASINDYGMTGNWCWLDGNHLLLAFLQFYGPLVVVVVFNIFLCVVIWKQLKKNTGSELELHSTKMKVFKRMTLYPLVLIICFLPAAIHRLYEFLKINEDNSTLNMIGIAGCCLYGFANSIVYGCTRNIRKKIKSKIFSSAYVHNTPLLIQNESISSSI